MKQLISAIILLFAFTAGASEEASQKFLDNIAPPLKINYLDAYDFFKEKKSHFLGFLDAKDVHKTALMLLKKAQPTIEKNEFDLVLYGEFFDFLTDTVYTCEPAVVHEIFENQMKAVELINKIGVANFYAFRAKYLESYHIAWNNYAWYEYGRFCPEALKLTTSDFL